MIITMSHGSGGASTAALIDDIFINEFNSDNRGELEDCAIVDGAERIAITTDSFVVTPVVYPGGDIGRLSVCGTVNDLLARGATPKYLTCGFILETGLDTAFLSEIVHSMAETAKEAGVRIVAGDTKVVEGNGGLMINTSGVGVICHDKNISSANAKAGDAIIVSGYLGEHHATILSTRLEIANDIVSDNAPLNDMVMSLVKAGVDIHTMRDVTRGGLATVLKEIAVASKVKIEIEDKLLPVPQNVRDFGGLLGLDPLYMGNEGKMVFVVPEAEEALKIIRSSNYGENAVVIGKAVDADEDGTLLLRTTLGGLRQLDVLQGEGLPRIC